MKIYVNPMRDDGFTNAYTSNDIMEMSEKSFKTRDATSGGPVCRKFAENWSVVTSGGFDQTTSGLFSIFIN